ncbi:MAG: tRNA (adenosine(37)-N6)-threonylcarbamoyltransferase complex dimerization subunit type 1 TsaB [Pseudobdellovibrio sp.]
MIILASETSTLLGSVAVVENGQVIATEESMRQGSHSDVLNVFIEKALLKAQKKLSDVDLFVSGIGPGSFTGIRVSVNTIKSLAYCFNKPVLGINSLSSLAYQAQVFEKHLEFEKTQVISMINAYKNMVYVATYRPQNGALIELKKPEVVRVQELPNYINERSIICGDGFLAYEKYFSENLKKNMIRIDGISDESHAQSLAQLALKNSGLQKWNELVPLYLRASEAEENLQGIKYQPLI